MTETAGKETREFQAEVRKLLHLMIHSLYSNREVFLRELISNASDALDKLRLEARSNESLHEGGGELCIRVAWDQTAKTITVSDNGIGMGRQEVIDNIGTIARSGTEEFVRALSGDQTKDANLIGQFGVGFYSSFIVADRVTLVTRRAGVAASEGVRWESDGTGSYQLEGIDKPTPGTDITLHLREDAENFLSDWELKSIIRKFSDHVPFPIRMKKEEGKEEEGKEEEGKEEEETVNQASALWAREKSAISAEEYDSFYKHVARDHDDPLAHLHAHLEGKYEYTLLLYIPKRAPFDLWDRESRHGVRLYVRRVFINEGSEELVPRYLRFLRGVVDSADLPLNVSREILQQNQVMQAIRRGLVGKALSWLEELAGGALYADLWKTFGKVLKEGVVEDYTHKERVAKLLRFASTHGDTPEQNVALVDYVARMKQGQEKIFYVTGDTFESARSSPHLELFREKGVEVLLLSDRVDEWLITHLTEFDGKPLQSVTAADLDLGQLENEEEKQKIQETEKTFSELVARMGACLGEAVREVRVSHRLTGSPSCLVTDTGDMGINLEKILKSLGQEVPPSRRILEVNPDHPLVRRLQEEQQEERFADWSHLLLDQASLSGGGQVADPAAFVQRMNALLVHLVRK